MKQQLTDLIKQILKEIGAGDMAVDLEVSDNLSHGDYSSPVALKLAKSLKKPPMEIALQVVSKIKDQKSKIKDESIDHNMSQKDQTTPGEFRQKSVLQDIEKVEVMSPGFINFFLTEAKLISQIDRALKDKEAYGKAQNLELRAMKSSPKVMVEFTDPNPFKEFHLGHLYSNAVGESLSRLLEATGALVKRADYFGDVGMHVAKSIWGMKSKLTSAGLTGIEKLKLVDRIKWLGEAYAIGSKAYEEKSSAKEEINRLNKLVYIAAQDLLTQKTGKKPAVEYRQDEVIDEFGLALVKDLFYKGRSWSLEYFETIYSRLGTKFDYYYAESQVGEYGVKLVLENTSNVFEKSEGAIIYRGEAEGLHTRVFLNQLGLPTYEAKELGLNWKKHQDWPFDKSYIVTGKEINEYFKVLLSAMKKIMPDVAQKTVHLGHGMVRLPSGKMSSRTGTVLTADWLLDEAKKAIYNILQKSGTKDKDVSLSNPTDSTHPSAPSVSDEEISEKAAIAAVKFSLLKVSLPSDITFDIDKSISFEGESGPYLQYTYARAKSVLRKANGELGIKNYGEENLTRNSLFVIDNSVSLNPEERAILRLLTYFPDIVAEAAAGLAPNKLCSYLFKLAQAFNLFYARHSILTAREKESKYQRVKVSKKHTDTLTQASHQASDDTMTLRLALTTSTAHVLKNGLYLLGIETLERM